MNGPFSQNPGARLDPAALPPAAVEFLTERHLATLTTIRPDGTPHVVPVGFTWDDEAGLARVITSGTSRKVANVRATGHAVLCQFAGRHWLSLAGVATVTDDPVRVAEAVARYTARYKPPRPNPRRVALEITVHHVLGRI